MTTISVDGRAIADQILGGLAEQVRALGAPIQLAAVCGGDDEGLKAFVRLKQKAAQSIGIEFSSYFFKADQEQEARQAIEYLAHDDDVHGIFIELPLPTSWDAAALMAHIPEVKDVDALVSGAYPAPAVRALQYVLDAHEIDVRSLRVAVVGVGSLVGRPIASWLTSHDAAINLIDITTDQPQTISSQADIVIAATGVPGLVTGDWIKPGAIVIDFGYGKKGNSFVGDVDAATVAPKASIMTPVPGGMGPLVIAAVLENVVEAATR